MYFKGGGKRLNFSFLLPTEAMVVMVKMGVGVGDVITVIRHAICKALK